MPLPVIAIVPLLTLIARKGMVEATKKYGSKAVQSALKSAKNMFTKKGESIRGKVDNLPPSVADKLPASIRSNLGLGKFIAQARPKGKPSTKADRTGEKSKKDLAVVPKKTEKNLPKRDVKEGVVMPKKGQTPSTRVERTGKTYEQVKPKSGTVPKALAKPKKKGVSGKTAGAALIVGGSSISPSLMPNPPTKEKKKGRGDGDKELKERKKKTPYKETPRPEPKQKPKPKPKPKPTPKPKAKAKVKKGGARDTTDDAYGDPKYISMRKKDPKTGKVTDYDLDSRGVFKNYNLRKNKGKK